MSLSKSTNLRLSLKGKDVGEGRESNSKVAADHNQKIINSLVKINNNLQAWYPPVTTPIGGCKSSSVHKLKEQHKFIHF